MAAHADDGKPNIPVIMGDDIGYGNISAFHNGVMGYETPCIDRLASEGGMLVSYSLAM
jgi:arylsulfatase A-like enzyme